MDLATIFARNLREQRARRNMSQQTLAAKAGVSVSYVSMLENAQRHPPLGTIEALAKALKVEPMALLDGAGRRR